MDALPLSKQVLKRRLYSFLKPGGDGVELAGLLGSEVCDASYSIDREGFPFLVMEFIEAGSIDIILDNESTSLRRGGFLCYGPGSRVSMKVATGVRCTKHFIAISPGAGMDLESLQGLFTEGRGLLVERIPVIRVLKFINLITDIAGDPEMWEVLVRSIDALGCFLGLLPKKRRPEVESTDEAFRAVTRFISEHFMKLKSLDEIADRCGYDKSYLCQIYKRHSEVSPYQQLLRMKMGYACILLETTDWKVRAIAESLGYEDSLHFSRLFKQKIGVSPSQFRPEVER